MYERRGKELREGVNGMRIAVGVVDQDPGYMIGTGAPLMKDEVDSIHGTCFAAR